MKRYLLRSMVLSVLSLALTMSMATGVFATELQEVFARGLSDHECDDAKWRFTITGIEGDVLPPASIHVTWANGAEADVSLDKVAGKVAHYTTTANLEWAVLSASTFISTEWDGQFKLSHGPCDVIGPGKGTVLSTEHHDDPMYDEHHDMGTSEHTSHLAELPKTGDAEVHTAALLAVLFGGALLLTGAAGRTSIRRA